MEISAFINKFYSLVLKDKSTFSYGIFRIVNLSIAPISAILIIKYLNIHEQGYLYTMNSLVALATYAELGLAQVITRLVSDSFHKNLSDESPSSKIELYNYLKFTLVAGIILMFVVFIFSILIFLFFFKEKIGNEPQLIKLFSLMSATSSFTILVSLLNGFLDACNKNISTNYRRISDSLLRIVSLYVLLFYEVKLFAFAYSSLLATLLSLIILLTNNYKFLKSIYTNTLHVKFDAKETFKIIVKKVLPLQIKYAQTWITGIFVNAMIIPIVFYYQGDSIAGRLGFSIALIGIIYNVASIIINSQIPYFASLNSQKKNNLLKDIYIKRNLLSIQIFILLSFILITFLFFDEFFFRFIYSRVLDVSIIILLIFAHFFKLLVENKAMFVRSFKVEPFVKIAWAQAIISILLMPLGTYFLGVTGTIYALLLGYFISFISIDKIFLKYKNLK